MQPSFRILEHPSDAGIEAYGASMKEAFESAALGLVSMVVDAGSVQALLKRTVSLEAADKEVLLVRWLNEILYLYDAERFLTSRTEIKQISDILLEAEIAGETYDPRKHILKLDVKAITYHQLSVERVQKGWSLRVFVDI